MKDSPSLTRRINSCSLAQGPCTTKKAYLILAWSASTYLGKYLRQVFWSVSDKWEESRHIGEHTGQDERILCFKIKDKLQQIYAIVHWDFLQRQQRERRRKEKRRQHSVLQPVAHILRLLELGLRAAAITSGLSAEHSCSQSRKKSSRNLSLTVCNVHLLREKGQQHCNFWQGSLEMSISSPHTIACTSRKGKSPLSQFGSKFCSSLCPTDSMLNQLYQPI